MNRRLLISVFSTLFLISTATVFAEESANPPETMLDASVMYPFNDKTSGKLEYAKFNESDVYGSLTNAARKGDF